MFCPNCGNEVAEGSNFCDRCGASLNQPSQSPIQSEQPPVQPDQPTVQLDQPPVQPPVQEVKPPVQDIQPSEQPAPVIPPVSQPQKAKIRGYEWAFIIIGAVIIVLGGVFAVLCVNGTIDLPEILGLSEESIKAAREEEEPIPGSWALKADENTRYAFSKMIINQMAYDSDISDFIYELDTYEFFDAADIMIDAYTFEFTNKEDYYVTIDPDGYRVAMKRAYRIAFEELEDMSISEYCDISGYDYDDVLYALDDWDFTWSEFCDYICEEYCDDIDYLDDDEIADYLYGFINDDDLIELYSGTYDYDEDEIELRDGYDNRCEWDIEYEKGNLTVESIDADSGFSEDAMEFIYYLEGGFVLKKK